VIEVSFEIYLHSRAHKYLKNLDKKTYNSILNKVKSLTKDPFPPDTKRVVGRKEKVFRLRIGKYRILYVVYLELNTVLIINIDKRSRAYR
jgi:mRNA interferase RelE/StbE